MLICFYRWPCVPLIGFSSLDSSLKRNTAFIKRLRTSLQAADSVNALLNEVKSLSLERYISELVSASIEGISRCKTGIEIYGATEVGVLCTLAGSMLVVLQ